MTLYRKKPVTVEAYKWMPDHETMDGRVPLPEWLKGECEIKNNCLFIHTLEGTLMAIPGDWIVKGVKGEVYPVRHDIFMETYEVVGEK